MIERLKDKYQIISEIGAGGMAKIYRAIQISSGRECAIKILAPDQKNNYSHKRRFLNEIELSKKIDSPYVVKIYDAEWDDDFQYMSMELIEGHILKNYINEKKRLTVDEVVHFAQQMALGFQTIHETGIVHRDIKSQNIMVGAHGQIKIIDFGIALNDSSERLTRTDSVIGSVHYMAPELVEHNRATPKSDIYALGILMYEMLTGDIPFKSKEAVEVLLKHKNFVVPLVNKSFPNIPNSITNIVARATRKAPSQRYDSMIEFYNDLTTALETERINESIEYSSSNNIVKNISKKGDSFLSSKSFFWIIVGAAGIVAVAIIIAVIIIFAT